jgi:hypothetical protein
MESREGRTREGDAANFSRGKRQSSVCDTIIINILLALSLSAIRRKMARGPNRRGRRPTGLQPTSKYHPNNNLLGTGS